MNMIEKRKRMRGQGGFTLIELLVVIAILAILGGIAVFAVGNLTGEADDAACKIERRTIKTAISAYKADNPSAAAPNTADLVGTWLEDTPEYFTVSSGNLVAVGTLPGTCTT